MYDDDANCVCMDCAVDGGHIHFVEGAYTTEINVTDPDDPDQMEMVACAGDECELQHDHDSSDSCEATHTCDTCWDKYEDEDDAQSCCEGWQCNSCEHLYTDYYAQSSAMECCLYTCEECSHQYWADTGHACEPGSNGMGMADMPPWERRGVTVKASDPGATWQDTWGVNFEMNNVVQAAADYYLLEAISAGLVGTTDGKGYVDGMIQGHMSMTVLRNEAKAMFSALVDEWDPILQTYAHIAIGGELRHHNAIGGNVLSSSRKSAWAGWKDVFDIVGTDALTDAADLFDEFEGGSFGGTPWAMACKILHARVTGKITPALFLDRIFNHQHNGGVFLNKVSWYGDLYSSSNLPMTLDAMTQNVLPAHGVDPEPEYGTLLMYASPQVKSLFMDSYKVAGYAARDLGISLSFRPARPSVALTPRRLRAQRRAKMAAEHQAYRKENAIPLTENKVKTNTNYARYYYKLALKEAAANARTKKGIESGDLGPCGYHACHNCDTVWSPSTYYLESHKTCVIKAITSTIKLEALLARKEAA